MTDQKIQPDRITKPIQLLAAWLVGLLAIDTCFLVAAARLPQDSWQAIALTLAAIVNVPLFLAAVFLLQTKFRPELQEDLYYSTYINQKTNLQISVPRDELRTSAVLARLERIEHAVAASTQVATSTAGRNLFARLTFGINKFIKDGADLSKSLSEHGISSHTWFGGEEPPEGRVVSISEYLPDDVTNAVLQLAKTLGFQQYNYFDNVIEDAQEDVLIGSYGKGERSIPNEPMSTSSFQRALCDETVCEQ
jgi:hypothetical protein